MRVRDIKITGLFFAVWLRFSELPGVFAAEPTFSAAFTIPEPAAAIYERIYDKFPAVHNVSLHVSAFFQQVHYRQMLRAAVFALSAFQTVGCFSFACGRNIVFLPAAVPAFVFCFVVFYGEYFRYCYACGAAVRAVMAGRAGDGLVAV